MKFAGINFSHVSTEKLLKSITSPVVVLPINAQVIGLANKDARLLNIINNYYAVVDGQVVKWGINIRAHFESETAYKKISGSDFIYTAANYAANNNLRIALIGGSQEANELSVKRLKNLYNVSIGGYSPPIESYPFSEAWVNNIIDFIEEFMPDYVFFGFGAPKQEFFIHENYKKLSDCGVKLMVACGGTFDFVAELKRRAPTWIREIGMEGIFRLMIEPKWFRVKRLIESVAAIRFFLS